MIRSEKGALIEELKGKFENNSFFYITDSTSLTVEKINKLRRLCYDKGVEIKVVKNTLAIKAMEGHPDSRNFNSIFQAFKGQSTILFSENGKLPATIIKEFRGKKGDKPVLKAAYIDSDVYYGDDQLDVLLVLKSKNELIGEIIGLLQSPAQNVVSALKSGGATLAGLLKTLEDRAQ